MQTFFHYSSKATTNDSAILPIIPPFDNKKVYSKYVYHNDKFNMPNGSRDEYRLYLNKDIDLDGRFYEPSDIVLFRKLLREQQENGFSMPTYLMYRIEPNDDVYETLEHIISNSDAKGGHALVETLPFEIKEIENNEDSEVVISEDAKVELIKNQEEILALEEEEEKEKNEDENDLETTRGANLFNSSSFRDFVLLGYGKRCAITKKVIEWKEFNNLEAAHIKPKAHSGTFLPCNGIALCRDMHWAFDKGFITISDDFKVIVHKEVKHTFLTDYEGKEILIPNDSYFQPASKFLEYHRENIFGLFKHSGMIRKI